MFATAEECDARIDAASVDFRLAFRDAAGLLAER